MHWKRKICRRQQKAINNIKVRINNTFCIQSWLDINSIRSILINYARFSIYGDEKYRKITVTFNCTFSH